MTTHAPLDEAAVTDLLGLLAYAQVSAFTRLMGDGDDAPRLATKLALARLAVAQFGRFEQLTQAMDVRGIDSEEAMKPFVKTIDDFHARTDPRDWVEALVKAYVGDGVAHDFYGVAAARLDGDLRDVVLAALREPTEHTDLLVTTVRAEIAREPEIVGRLSLFGRRLAGEALSQAQRVAVDHPVLAGLLVGQDGGYLAGLSTVLSQLTQGHAARMESLGLTP